MTITNVVIREIIRKLIKNEAYGIEVSNLLNAEFMQYAIEFFKKVATAKLNSESITKDWYKKRCWILLCPKLNWQSIREQMRRQLQMPSIVVRRKLL